MKNLLLATTIIAAGLFHIGNNSSETLLLNGEVTEESMNRLSEDLVNDGRLMNMLMTRTLVINSPGGTVKDLEFFKAVRSLSNAKFDTVTYGLAASCAADIFLLGQNRLMGSEATVLFHELRLMVLNEVITYTDLKSVFEKGKLGPNSELEGKRLLVNGIPLANLKQAPLSKKPRKVMDGDKDNEDKSKKALTIVDDIKVLFGERLGKIVKDMDKAHESHIKFIMKRLGQDREFVLKHLLIPNVDVELDLDTALKLGVATGKANDED